LPRNFNPALIRQQVDVANRRPGISRLLPQRHRRRLFERIGAVLHEQREQRRRKALPHRPALELRIARDPRRVALRDNPSLVHDEEGGGQRVWIRERGRRRGLELRSVDVGRRSRVGPIAHGPRLRVWFGKPTADGQGREVNPGLVWMLNDAALIAVEACFPGDRAK
jgi:hypothetical protein